MKRYYEDIELHQKERLGPLPLTEQGIIDFALRWDPLPLHTDPASEEARANGGVIASGFHLLAICQRLFVGENPPAILIGLGIDEVRFLSPGRPGDTLVLEMEVIARRESASNPAAGIVTHFCRLLNGDGKTVLTYKGAGMIEKREKVAG